MSVALREMVMMRCIVANCDTMMRDEQTDA